MSSGIMGILRRFLARPPLGFKVAILVFSAVFYGAAGFIYFERHDKPDLEWLDGLWWAVVSMTTVGYGDYFPATTPGRFLVAYPIMLIGVGFVAYGLTTLAGFFMRAESLNRKGLMMTNAKNHIIVCNYPSESRFLSILHELRYQPMGKEAQVVLVDEELMELPHHFSDANVLFVKGNPAYKETLQRAGFAHCTRAMVLAKDPMDAGCDTATTAICLTLKALRSDLHVVAECVDGENKEILARSGCNSIVCVTNLAPGILAQEACDPGVVEVLHELTVWQEHINNIFIVPINFSGNSFVARDLHRWAEGNAATILGVRTAVDAHIALNVSATRPLVSGDHAIVMSRQRPTEISLVLV